MPEWYNQEAVNAILTRPEFIQNCVTALVFGIVSGTVSLIAGLPRR